MAKFFATARYCTRRGNVGRWSATLDADDINAPVQLARQPLKTASRRIEN